MQYLAVGPVQKHQNCIIGHKKILKRWQQWQLLFCLLCPQNCTAKTYCLWGALYFPYSHTLAYAKPCSSRFVTKGITTSLSKDRFNEIKIPEDALHTKKSSLRIRSPEMQKKYLEEGTTEHIQKQRYSASHFLGTGYGPLMDSGHCRDGSFVWPSTAAHMYLCSGKYFNSLSSGYHHANPYVKSLLLPEAVLTVLSSYNFSRTLT